MSFARGASSMDGRLSAARIAWRALLSYSPMLVSGVSTRTRRGSRLSTRSAVAKAARVAGHASSRLRSELYRTVHSIAANHGGGCPGRTGVEAGHAWGSWASSCHNVCVVSVMTVESGLGVQEFVATHPDKIGRVRELAPELEHRGVGLLACPRHPWTTSTSERPDPDSTFAAVQPATWTIGRPSQCRPGVHLRGAKHPPGPIPALLTH